MNYHAMRPRQRLIVALTVTAAVAVAAVSLTAPASAQDANPHRMQRGNQYGVISIPGMTATLPATSENVIEDQTVLERPGGGVRVFRLYDAVPLHYHNDSDAILYVLTGRGRFQIADEEPIEAGAGDMLFWAAGTMHGTPEILEGPIDVLVVDLPTRDPTDTIWANPKDAPSFLK